MLINVLSSRIRITLLLYLLVAFSYGVKAKQTISASCRSIDSTCPSRTINYITATLPQQCLRTDWSKDHASPTKNVGISQVPGSNDSSASLTLSPATHESTEVPKLEANATILSDAAQKAQDEQDQEADPLSDNANFLSFEEWKAQMLQRTGQSPEHVAGTKMHQRKDPRAGAHGINNALDGYGEDGEIEIAFGGFPIADVEVEAVPPSTSSIPESAPSTDASGERPHKRSKEAGTTSKLRFNYASLDCAATVRKTNPGSKGSTSILSENKDSYLINPCSSKNKFVIVELCNDINIDTIVLGNFEFFSSTFRSFRVSVADRYPAKADKWEDIGTFEARNSRGIQAFLVDNMRTWGRYLRIEFLTHYGTEYYCPVSLLRVHGKTMMEDWKADVKASQGEDENDDEEEAEDVVADKVVAEPVKETPSSATTSEPDQTSSHVSEHKPEASSDYSFYDAKCPRCSLRGPLVEQVELVNAHCHYRDKFCNMAMVPRLAYTSIRHQDVRIVLTKEEPEQQPSSSKPSNTRDMEASKSSEMKSISSTATIFSDATNSHSSTKVTGTSTAAKSSPKLPESSSTKAASDSKPPASKTTAHAVASVAPQDSFFRSVHKRLQQLEANSTLSLQYIEEQSRILREAFTKVEKRQLSKTSNFLETLNSTVLNELRQFRLQYDQIWQSTVLELSAQREQSQREVTALSQRLTLLAEEMIWQKRLAVFQFGLILLCLALVVFSRNATGASTFDLPLLQNMVSKPHRFARYLNIESPGGSPSRPSSRYERFARSWTHFRSPSNPDMSDDEGQHKSPTVDEPYQLATPTSELDDRDMALSVKSSPESDLLLRRAASAPSLIQETDDILASESEDEGDGDGDGDGDGEHVDDNDNDHANAHESNDDHEHYVDAEEARESFSFLEP